MPPKKKANEPSKKTEAKKKEKIIEVHFYFRQNGSLHLVLKSLNAFSFSLFSPFLGFSGFWLFTG